MPHKLTNNTVHIWQVKFNLFYNKTSEIKRILAAEEIKKAERFHFEKDKNRFIIHRGFLRKILSGYLNILPAEIKFEYKKSGKPFIDKNPPIFFNSSHSNNIGLFAVSKAGQVGVDVEHIRPVTDLKLLTKRFFAEEEYRLICLLPEEKKLKKFFEIWTLKEAYLKATGEGLAGRLKNIAVKFNQDNKPAVFYKNNRLSDYEWSVKSFKVEEDYYGGMIINAENAETIFLQADFSVCK